ncbi:L-arabinose transport system permease protein AraQ [bioreactor metagenome]|jgi:sn-glycerol 3-phosphate transport system permease protein|uniref:L-arabinose transport system permease protein AraQ n=1 Tax=bioreactor metagenome TaxID=1076179 RepID=A0A644SYC4_9ZZZZ
MKMNIGVKRWNISVEIIKLVILIIVVVVFVFPFFWILSNSLKTFSETMTFPPSVFPKKLIFSNYLEALNRMPFFKYLMNSITVNILILVSQFIVIVPASYAFAMYRFRGKGLLFTLVLFGFMLPQQLTFVPIYLLFGKMKLLNTYIPLVLPFAASSFGIFLLRQYFMGIPMEIIEAGYLDGMNNRQIMLYIMMPMAKSALASIALISFITHWNDYFWPLVMTNTQRVRTLPLGVAALRVTDGTTEWNVLMAANMLLILPILITYFFAHRQIKEALIHSGIK